MNFESQEKTQAEFLEQRMGKIKDLFCNDYVMEAINLVRDTGLIF